MLCADWPIMLNFLYSFLLWDWWLYASHIIFPLMHLNYIYMYAYVYTFIDKHIHINKHWHHMWDTYLSTSRRTHSYTHTLSFLIKQQSLWPESGMNFPLHETLLCKSMTPLSCLNKRIGGFDPYIYVSRAHVSFHSELHKIIFRLYLKHKAIWMKTKEYHSLPRCASIST